MGSGAEAPVAADLVADAFGVRRGALHVILAELEVESSRQHSDVLARRLGLRNRFQLARLLTGHDLPSLTSLRMILWAVTRVHRWETQGLPLSRQALLQGRDPAAWSKSFRRITGHHWREIRDWGAQGLAIELARRFSGGSRT